MKDIKIKSQSKNLIISRDAHREAKQNINVPNKKIEKVEASSATNVVLDTVTKNKVNFSVFSSVLLTCMFVSIAGYISLVSTSVLFAVNASRYTYNMENLKATQISLNMNEKNINNPSDRISYINKQIEQSVSMK